MIKALEYVGFTSPEAGRWRSFGPDILGLEALPAGDCEAVRLRLDDAPWRIEVAPGAVDALAFVGWDVGNEAALTAAVDQLRQAGITVDTGDASLAEARDAAAVACFLDPFGFRHELCSGRRVGESALRLSHGVSGFVTGEQGLGHIVFLVPDLELASKFFIDLLGFRHSDDIEMGFKLRFLHCNPRHHTLALSEVRGMRGVHHLMLEVRSLDDVGRAYDRALKAGAPIAMTLGRHTNDEMTSFYVRTPSGFEIEYGCGGRHIDLGSQWTVGHYDATSYWGHKPPAQPLFPGVLSPMESET